MCIRDRLGDVATTLLQSKEYDGVVIFMGLMDSIADNITQCLLELKRSTDCPVFVIWMGGKPACVQKLSNAGMLTFDEIPELVVLLGRSKPN